MAGSSGDIIDLCDDSFTLVDHRGLQNVFIDLNDSDSIIICGSENSFDASKPSPSTTANPTKQKKIRRSKLHTPADHDRYKKKNIRRSGGNMLNMTHNKENPSRFGDCPICFDGLGEKVIASTKCGHVYCMKCIKEYLKYNQRCPTCRQSLKGKSSYHPLYLNR